MCSFMGAACQKSAFYPPSRLFNLTGGIGQCGVICCAKSGIPEPHLGGAFPESFLLLDPAVSSYSVLVQQCGEYGAQKRSLKYISQYKSTQGHFQTLARPPSHCNMCRNHSNFQKQCRLIGIVQIISNAFLYCKIIHER